MSFLVLCPRCRHQVSVQESMAGQPARCPYCKMPFQVPSPPRPASPPAPQPSAVPPRESVTAGRPAANPRSQPSVAPRKRKPRSHVSKIPPPDPKYISIEPPRSSRTLFLGVLSAGIVILLLAGTIGTVVYLSRDQAPSSPVQGSRETSVAQAKPQQATKNILQQPNNETPPKSAVKPDKLPQRDGDATPETPPSEAAEAKRKTEKTPPPRREEEEPIPPRKEPAKTDPPAKEEPPEPASPAKEEPSNTTPAPKTEAPKLEPPVRKEPPKREEPAKVEVPKADPPERKEAPSTASESRAEATTSGEQSSSLPERRRLNSDELYRRLVKSCVYVRNREGWGSGSLIHKARKLVLTNYHVVEGNKEVSVSFPRYDRDGKLIVNGKVYEDAHKDKELIRGRVLKRVEEKDLALVELDTVPDETPALKLAARSASPGQDVHSIGNAGASDARWQYTHGKVKQLSHKKWKARGGLGKVLTFDADILETQSPTNPGDSGGPLVNDALQLVGVTQGADVSARELSYFIDVSEVKKLLQDCDVDLSEVTASPDDAGGIVEAGDIFALIKCLDDTNARVRGEAANRLAELGPQARRAAPALTKTLRDPESFVRQSAAVALGKLGPSVRDPVRKEVFKALRDTDEEVRLAALEALGNLGTPDLAELPLLLDMLGKSVERQQFKPCLLIARSLALLGPKAQAAVPDLRAMLKSEDRPVRAAALMALRKIGSAAHEAAPELSEALKDNDSEMRIQAALTLLAIDSSLVGAGREALPVLVKALRPSSNAEGNGSQAKERIKEISAVLVKIGEPAVERLLRAIEGEFRRSRGRTEDAALDAQAREAALKIIADMGPSARSNRAIAALAELQRNDPSPKVREAARRAYIAIQDSR